MKKIKWSNAEIELLKKYYPIHGSKYCLNLLNRTEYSITNMAAKLKITYKYKWGNKEINFLKINYKKLGALYCSNKLNRTIESIYLKANKLELNYNDKWSIENQNFLIKNYDILGVDKCSKILNKNRKSVLNKAFSLNLTLYTTKGFINKSFKIHEDKYNYSKVNYNKSNDKLIIICPKHGEFIQTAQSHLSGRGCPICNESKGEKKIRFFLSNKKINFSQQHTFNNCRNTNLLPFDFYLLKYNLCIEFNGKQHYEPIKYFGGDKTLINIKINDSIKKKFCMKNDIKLIIIKYDMDVDNILLNILK